MIDVFLSYGVTPERAEVCAEVLVESDRRGIDRYVIESLPFLHFPCSACLFL